MAGINEDGKDKFPVTVPSAGIKSCAGSEGLGRIGGRACVAVGYA